MAIDKKSTPLPAEAYVPIQVEVPDWFDLAANDKQTVMDLETFKGQAIDVHKIGGRPETDVNISVSGQANTERGTTTDQQDFHSTAFGSFNNPAEVGPFATQRLQVKVDNQSNTDHTQASGTPYQWFINYVIKEVPVLEKLRRNIPLTNQEAAVVREFGLDTRERLAVPPDESPIHQPNLVDKRIITDDAVVETVDIDNTGESNAVTLLDQNIRASEVIYVTGLQVNGQNYTEADNLIIDMKRADERQYYDIETFGVPDPTYTMDLHLPFLDKCIVTAYASQAVTDVDVKIEYTRVERTLLEKALYGLEEEVKANDDLADRRRKLYDVLRKHISTGLPLNQEKLIEATAPDMSARARGRGR